MNHRLSLLVVVLLAGYIGPRLFAAPSSTAFQLAVLWEGNTDRGVLLVSPTEMLVIDSKGQKYGKVTSKEAVLRVYVSPDAKKLAYTTVTGVWLAKLDTGENSEIAKGECNFFRWDSNGAGLLFSIGAYLNGDASQTDTTRLFWADGDGKNLKQVYP